MSLPPLGRQSGAAHHEYCNTALCCRCQQRSWTTRSGTERLCGPCAACCRDCGRAPAPHVDGLNDGLCAECRGLCGRCHAQLPFDGACPCRKWRERAAGDPVAYILQALPQPLTQAFSHRIPHTLHELIHQELSHRSADQLLDRLERRWNTRWAHALYEKDEDGRRRWTAQDIAEQLLRPGHCQNPPCEDGYLVTTGTACGHCRRPLHRFVPSVAENTATSEHARTAAAGIRRALLANRGARKSPGTGSPPRQRGSH
ncbi:hypothetical protein ACPXCE_17835 [Streptomyces sp. DT24]|uniref:hypothetical protein n=1 Tax=unclassified Streptomyces TaxID=2593676 RepID=UPI0023B921FB|nr:hypothetical protein [Streptomyces sp. AM 4-1-1]WEH32101.1 hypothetical protein PZB75_01110 [Streptomyces sp. AM 4-1-1]